MSKLIQDDCVKAMKQLKDNSIDAVITDPPYGLEFMGKEWDTFDKAQFGRKGAEGKNDLKVKKNFNVLPRYKSGGLYEFTLEWATEALRVLKPGGYLLSFGGTRTYHRMAVAIEDAGFEIRDMIEWVYGSGFPKSLNIGKAIDKLQGNKRKELGFREDFVKRVRKNGVKSKDYILAGGWKADPTQVGKITKGTSEWEGWGTSLKPAHEPICMARKPLSEKTVAKNVLKWGTGGINIDESRVNTFAKSFKDIRKNKVQQNCYGKYAKGIDYNGSTGRFPANLIHDGSKEVKECFPNAKGASSQNNHSNGKIYRGQSLLESETKLEGHRDWYNDNGSASRFFKSIIYQAKASKRERNIGLEEEQELSQRPSGVAFNEHSGIHSEKKKGNLHPTVKPVTLMEYLINMVTPKGGTVLDPFMGSGTTGMACKKLKRKFIGIEKEKEYVEIAKARINAVKEPLL